MQLELRRKQSEITVGGDDNINMNRVDGGNRDEIPVEIPICGLL